MRIHRKTISLLLILLLCTGLLSAGFACPFSPLHAEVSAGANTSAEEVINVDPIYIQPGCKYVNLDLKAKYPDWDFTYYTKEGETNLTVDQNGLVTMLTDVINQYFVYARGKNTRTGKVSIYSCPIAITNYKEQDVVGPSSINAIFGKKVQLKVTAKTHLTYRSDTKSIARVDSSGLVTFLRPGKAIIVAVADGDDYYMGNCLVITITCKLAKPKVKAKACKGKVKLRWSETPRAQKYLVYVKYPGKKRYKLAAKKSAITCGISHKNLKKGKKYSYKVRAYMKLKGKKYYSPYSKPVTVRVK